MEQEWIKRDSIPSVIRQISSRSIHFEVLNSKFPSVFLHTPTSKSTSRFSMISTAFSIAYQGRVSLE